MAKEDIKIVRINSRDEIVVLLRKLESNAEKIKTLKEFLMDKYVGTCLQKEFNDTVLAIKERGADIRKIVGKVHTDTYEALTQLDKLLEASEYIGESIAPNHKKNNYFWYFKVPVIIDKKRYEYVLNIGRNKFDGNIAIYDLTNYNKKDVNPNQISNMADITSSKENISKQSGKVK